MSEQNTDATKTTASGVKTLVEAINGITGYDEVAIEQAFGEDFWDVHDQIDEDTSTRVGRQFSRMLIFADLIHKGTPADDAYAQVMAMVGRMLDSHFEPEPDEVFPDEPETAAGKESSASESGTPSSLRSA